jgi:dTDP-4-amino-4,6-dideoxygalactose transaminase
MINVTKSFLPPIEEYTAYLQRIYATHWLTSHGPLLKELEERLKGILGIPDLMMVSNGTLALQLAIKALHLKGDILTTPFSYVATTSSIVWENCNPVFVDIDPDDLNMAPQLIEEAITPRTTAILATHVYGNACRIDEIKSVADRHGLRVIYDAAHCFGTLYKGQSIFNCGDVSTTSLHATKVFHTVEGGIIFSSLHGVLEKVALLRNFGHTSPVSFDGVGINAKNSEFHAAMGLCNLKYLDAILAKRKMQWLYYREALRHLGAQFIRINPDCTYNYAYFPVVFPTEEILLRVMEALNAHEVFPRRYFYPSLSTLDYVQKRACPVVESIASRVLCLPLFHDLTLEEQDMIVETVLKTQNKLIQC